MGACKKGTNKSQNHQRIEKSEFLFVCILQQILFNINKAICLRLDAIETKLDNVTARNKQLEEKVDQLSAQLKSAGNVVLSQSKG